MGKHLDLDDVAHGNPVAVRELDELRTAAARYEEVRKWSPSVFVGVWTHCMTNSLDTFDGMVDAMRSSNIMRERTRARGAGGAYAAPVPRVKRTLHALVRRSESTVVRHNQNPLPTHHRG